MAEINTQVLIIGSGPAGYTAGIYAIRAGIKTTLLTGFQTGGQLTTTTEIENFPGFAKPIYGAELMSRMGQQCQNLGVDIVVDGVKSVDFNNKPFKVFTENGNTYVADSVIIATGSSAKKANIKGEEKFWGFGVSVCATCDGFFYRNKDVIVIGGGNAAVTEALHLADIANSVTLVHRRDELRAEKIIADRLLAHKKIKVEWDSVVEEIYGTEKPNSVTGAKLKNLKTNYTKDLNVAGVFVSVGYQPNTDLFKDYIELDDYGYIKMVSGTNKTSLEGVFAAGDVTNPKHKQAIIAAASGCEAGLDAVAYLKTKGK